MKKSIKSKLAAGKAKTFKNTFILPEKPLKTRPQKKKWYQFWK